MNEIYVKIQDIRKSFDQKEIIKGISLELYKNEILALLGSNGAGKTTLIKIMAGLLAKDSGSIEILGSKAEENENLVKNSIGYVGQDTDRSAYGRLTVRENLLFFGQLQGMKSKEINTAMEKLNQYFNFQENMNKQFMILSGGQKQTVIIMRALLHNPEIIFLDEPTKGLDPISSQRLRNFIKNYVSEEKKSMILTSHILPEVEELAHRVAFIDDGKIQICDSLSEIKAGVGVSDFIEINRSAINAMQINKLKTAGFVKTIESLHENWLSIGVDDFYSGTQGILSFLKKENIQCDFRHRTVTLEDAFIKTIGALK